MIRRRALLIAATIVALATEAHAFGNLGSMGRGFGHLGAASAKKAPSAPVLWTPLNDPNLVAWWDASYLPSLSFNVGNVAAWTDRKSGIAAAQGVGANQPGWSATARNGTPGLTFNGSKNLVFSTNAALPTGTAPSWMAVSAFVTTSASFQAIVAYGAAVAGQQRALGRYNNGNAYITIGNTDLQGPAWANSDIFLEGLWNSATQTGLADGTAFGPGAATFNTTLSSGIIGANIGNSIPFTGTVQQIVITNTALSTSVRQKYEGWESWYDGKAGVNLPSSNPYSSTGTLNRAPLVSDP